MLSACPYQLMIGIYSLKYLSEVSFPKCTPIHIEFSPSKCIVCYKDLF
jgi:hypothetical protein